MNKYVLYIITFSIGMLIGMASIWHYYTVSEILEEEKESEDICVKWRTEHFKLSKENLYSELVAQEIDYPEIVLAQALLETGNFKSYSCRVRNNLFGLMHKDGTYMEFDHWTNSVHAYKKYIQKYKEVPNDYYKYLNDLGYAEDSIYVIRVKEIAKNDRF
mgnify:CR=1 FL=1